MQQETDAYTNLISMDAAARKESELRKQQAIGQARGSIAQAKNTEFDIANQNYQQQLQSAQAMQGAGMQNIMGGIQGLGSTALTLGSTMYKPGGATAQASVNGSSSSTSGNLGTQWGMNYQGGFNI